MNEEEPKAPPAAGFAVSGCLFSALIWSLGAFLVLGIFGGDCLPRPGHLCPSDHERNLRALRVIIAVVGINVLGLYRLARLRARPDKRN